MTSNALVLRLHAVQPLGLQLLLGAARRIRCGRLSVTLPDGTMQDFDSRRPGPAAVLQIRDPRLTGRLLAAGAVGFAEGYIAGEADSPDLVRLIELAVRNQDALGDALAGRFWYRALQRLVHLNRANSRKGARRNIAEHYDLGNDFYAAWLDPDMVYSAALFDAGDRTLDQAQEAKFRRIARLARLEPDSHVLEIGCGWGGFAAWAAREIGCRVTATTISHAQYDYARRRIAAAGLQDRVTVLHHDYRDLTGEYDSIVAIEMLEAVGERYWPVFFARLGRLLRPGGTVALQVITIAEASFARYRRGADFIQRHIFPGGMLPSRTRLAEEAAAAGLHIEADEGFGLDYARTLACWSRRFEAAWPDIAMLGFDERFRRLWRYYLAYSEAGFRAGRIDLRQIALGRS